MDNNTQQDTTTRLKEMIGSTGLRVFEETVIESRAGSYSPVPDGLNWQLTQHLKDRFPRGLYSHQAQALRIFAEGRDLCMATSTASGKSLVFISAATHLLLEDPQAKVLAFYPAKALIRDQFSKWQEAVAPFDLGLGVVDGSVQTGLREGILQRCRIVLMTPDVAHAWLMSKLNLPAIKGFLTCLRLLIMDEAHVYDGVFGTNMAFFIRRLLSVSGVRALITSTATIGEPERYIEALTGRRPELVGPKDEGSPRPVKSILSLVIESGSFFENTVGVVRAIAQAELGRFLVFADSRKVVEQIVSIAERSDEEKSEGEESRPAASSILPYRAGYEEEDRAVIQDALAGGTLQGVVSTSALELGLDIGDIDIVVLLRTPRSMNSFWQRIGRAGRQHEGHVLIINDMANLTGSRSLTSVLRKPQETGWLYLDNIYIQYIHALCAAQELTEYGKHSYNRAPFSSLPPAFARMVGNEVSPTEGIEAELYPLKLRAQNGPHYEFALRSDSGKTFSIAERHGPNAHALGSVNYPQALREAYPGAMYYYMARPYRVTAFSYRTAEISVTRGSRITTQPVLQNMVFPKIPGGVRSCRRSEAGFIVEADVQVNERVLGFREQHGKQTEQHLYGPDSNYSQRPLVRFFETTGVLWFFDNQSLLGEAIGELILQAYCSAFGIQDRDLGLGLFFARPSSVWNSECTGLCVYDTVAGSLKLSKRLFHDFLEVLELAEGFVEPDDDDTAALLDALQSCCERVRGFADHAVEPIAAITAASGESDWKTVIAPGQPAILRNIYGEEEVEVVEFRYTPRGLMYRLRSRDPEEVRMVPCDSLIPLPGQTDLIETNLLTGETRSLATRTTP